VARGIGVKAANLGVMRLDRLIHSVLLPRPAREAGLSYAGDDREGQGEGSNGRQPLLRPSAGLGLSAL
jgi:sensor domain CHASE-containing protein